MLYDSNGFKPYIYILILITWPCTTLIYIYSIGSTPKSVEYHFFQAVSDVFGTAEIVFTRHVRPLAWTYLASRRCPGLGFSAYKGALTPFEP
jgi:hypothetical protein